MADDQGLDLADGEFARGVTGSAVKALLANSSEDGRGFRERTAEPSNPENGDVYLADGSTWDPDGDAVAGAELVIYYGGTWTEIVGGL